MDHLHELRDEYVATTDRPWPEPGQWTYADYARLPEDNWNSHTGFIHEVLRREYLGQHAAPAAVEYYLCGPQPMIQAARTMLEGMGVERNHIAFDEF
jgi:Na+-transporting NADH:ubiquinone oxidoreductase subunit F